MAEINPYEGIDFSKFCRTCPLLQLCNNSSRETTSAARGIDVNVEDAKRLSFVAYRLAEMDSQIKEKWDYYDLDEDDEYIEEMAKTAPARAAKDIRETFPDRSGVSQAARACADRIEAKTC